MRGLARATLWGWCAAGACLAATPEIYEQLTRMERPGFAIEVPRYFDTMPDQGGALALIAVAPASVDQRNLAWEMSIFVQAARGGNPRRRTVDESVAFLLRTLAAELGKTILEAPVIETVEIPQADGARLMTYRMRADGRYWCFAELYVNAGSDVYRVIGWRRARPGSDVLTAEHPCAAMLRKSLLSFRPAAWPATQPAATQPAAPSAGPQIPDALRDEFDELVTQPHP
jgi:hypothetical protein